MSGIERKTEKLARYFAHIKIRPAPEPVAFGCRCLVDQSTGDLECWTVESRDQKDAVGRVKQRRVGRDVSCRGPGRRRDLEISAGNLWVLLHRARLQMIRCLEIHWFNAEGRP